MIGCHGEQYWTAGSALSNPLTMVGANNQAEQLNNGGKMLIQTSDKPIELEVVHAPSFKENLISTKKLARDHGATVAMEDREAVVKMDGNLNIIDQSQNSHSATINAQ